jgi:hypothetical protein
VLYLFCFVSLWYTGYFGCSSIKTSRTITYHWNGPNDMIAHTWIYGETSTLSYSLNNRLGSVRRHKKTWVREMETSGLRTNIDERICHDNSISARLLYASSMPKHAHVRSDIKKFKVSMSKRWDSKYRILCKR